MKGLLNKSSACLLACVEPEMVPEGVQRNSFTLEEIQSLYGTSIYFILYFWKQKKLRKIEFVGEETSVQLLESKAYPNNVEDNTFMLTWS